MISKSVKTELPGFETHKNYRPKAAVVFPSLPTSLIQLSPEARLEEACGLALAINLDVVFADIVKLREVKPATFLGHGYLEKLQEIIGSRDIPNARVAFCRRCPAFAFRLFGSGFQEPGS